MQHIFVSHNDVNVLLEYFVLFCIKIKFQNEKQLDII